MTGGFLDGNIFRGLAFRILVFLTLALLPFGLIAVFQTREIARQADFNAELSLIALTNQAIDQERAILQEGFGAAEALSAVAQIYGNNYAECSNFLAAYKRASGIYSFVGYVTTDGVIRCSSERRRMDLEADAGIDLDAELPQRMVTSFETGLFGDAPELVLTQPLFLGGSLAGHMILSVPQRDIQTRMMEPLQSTSVDVATFNSRGDIVRSGKAKGVIEQNLPADRALRALVGQQPVVFNATSVGGDDRIYTIVPVVPGVAYSISVWRPEDMQAGLSDGVSFSLLLPVLMWLASLIVAFWSLNRLAVRHIKKLGRQMRHFAYNRRVPRTSLGAGVPTELVEIQKAFTRMADSIVRDEAALEDNLRDKNILLKEVHHRVKNNLQLISSIMNMQIRRAQSDDARFVLKKLQDRILSLATVHKNLYQSDELDRVDAGVLLEEIIGQLMVVGLPAGRRVDIEQSYASVQMDADDAAPLTLLASEAVTNAMKYIGTPDGTTQAYLRITLENANGEDIVFRIVNSTSDAVSSGGSGLGSQLISAFARQLNGQVDVSVADNEHALVLTFPLSERVKERYDF